MIKCKDQSEKSKQVSMDSWLLELLSEKHENKNNKQRSTNKESKSKKITESKSNEKYNTYHGLLSQKWIHGIPILNLVCHVNPGNE